MSDTTPSSPSPSASVTSDAAAATALVRRRLLALGGTAAVGAVASVASAGSASAAPATQAWLAGGNANVTSNGTNFIGPLNVAPIIFKTTTTNGVAPTEKARIAPNGRVGVGVPAPTARLDVKTSDATGVAAVTTDGTTVAVGVRGTSASGTGVRGESAANYGVRGAGGYAGVQGDGGPYGGIFSGSSVGAYGTGTDYGVYAVGGSYGVVASGTTSGVQGSGPVGVRGVGSTTGVSGTTADPNGASVLGDGGQYGVQGVNARTAGIRGDSGYVGAWGQGTSYGVYGLSTDTVNVGYGLFGQASSAAGWALYAQGNARVTGTLTKSAGSFRIDHPLDPENRWLSHSFVESPDMMNLYNGIVVLDARGTATVELPDWFDALNRDFRYQLTPIGAPAPRLHVAQEISGRTFRIAGGSRGLRVSWQVTGIRHDDYAVAHPIPVEEDKVGAERGTRSFVPPGSTARAFSAVASGPRPDDAPVAGTARTQPPLPALPTPPRRG